MSGIIAGRAGGSSARFVADLANVHDSEDICVLPRSGQGLLRNLGDVMHLRGVDIGIDEEIHWIVSEEVTDIRLLVDRKIVFDRLGNWIRQSTSESTAPEGPASLHVPMSARRTTIRNARLEIPFRESLARQHPQRARGASR